MNSDKALKGRRMRRGVGSEPGSSAPFGLIRHRAGLRKMCGWDYGKPDLLPGTPGNLMVISGIFFLYGSYEGLSGKWGLSARDIGTRISHQAGSSKACHLCHIEGHFRKLFSCTVLTKDFPENGV